MKKNTKSSITLPPKELALVERLMLELEAKSKVEVIRRGLVLLKNQTDRTALRMAYAEASYKAKLAVKEELDELDALSDEGIE